MTHSNFSLLLRRAHEHVIASAAALALTAVLLVGVNANAATRASALTPSVTILVPTVTIEALTN